MVALVLSEDSTYVAAIDKFDVVLAAEILDTVSVRTAEFPALSFTVKL